MFCCFFSEQTNQCELQRVSVLILVYQQITIPIVVFLAHFRNIAQQADCLNQQIVKIERIVLLQAFFILLKTRAIEARRSSMNCARAV